MYAHSRDRVSGLTLPGLVLPFAAIGLGVYGFGSAWAACCSTIPGMAVDIALRRRGRINILRQGWQHAPAAGLLAATPLFAILAYCCWQWVFLPGLCLTKG
jgi:hypothetical protein